MLGLSIEVCKGLALMASVAFSASLEVVILALSTDPSTIREVKVILV